MVLLTSASKLNCRNTDIAIRRGNRVYVRKIETITCFIQPPLEQPEVTEEEQKQTTPAREPSEEPLPQEEVPKSHIHGNTISSN